MLLARHARSALRQEVRGDFPHSVVGAVRAAVMRVRLDQPGGCDRPIDQKIVEALNTQFPFGPG